MPRNIKSRGPNGLIPTPPDLVFLYRKKGMTLQELGERFEMSHATVARHLERLGVERKHKKGRESHAWKGGVTVNRRTGRVSLFIPTHHRARKNGYVNRAVVVWERKHKKKLPRHKIIHHRNEKPWDDRPNNLVAMTKPKHQSHHHKGKKYSPELKKIWSEIRKEWWRRHRES
jgi:DNA-binding transcriptional ArsR family regulator